MKAKRYFVELKQQFYLEILTLLSGRRMSAT